MQGWGRGCGRSVSALICRPPARAPQFGPGCTGGHHSNKLRPAGPESSGSREAVDGAERGDPRSGRSRGSDLMVTLRGVVHCSEPGTSPRLPSTGGTAGFLRPDSAQGGQPPSASYVQGPAHWATGRLCAHSPAAAPPSLGPGCGGSRPPCGRRQEFHPLGPSPGRPRQDPGPCTGTGLQSSAAKS